MSSARANLRRVRLQESGIDEGNIPTMSMTRRHLFLASSSKYASASSAIDGHSKLWFSGSREVEQRGMDGLWHGERQEKDPIARNSRYKRAIFNLLFLC